MRPISDLHSLKFMSKIVSNLVPVSVRGFHELDDYLGSKNMGMKRHGAEQIVSKLRQIEVLMSQGKGLAAACKEAAISEQSYYRWRKEYGGLKLAQAKKLKELERENARLKRIVADLSLEKAMLKEVASGNW